MNAMTLTCPLVGNIGPRAPSLWSGSGLEAGIGRARDGRGRQTPSSAGASRLPLHFSCGWLVK